MATEAPTDTLHSAFVFCEVDSAASEEQQPARLLPAVHPSVAALSAPSSAATSENASTRGDEGAAIESTTHQSSTAVATGPEEIIRENEKESSGGQQASLSQQDQKEMSIGQVDTVVHLSQQEYSNPSTDASKLKADGRAGSFKGTSQSIYLANDDISLSIALYQGSLWRLCFWYSCCILTVGILIVCGHWSPRFWLWANTRPVDIQGKSVQQQRKTRLYAAVKVGRSSLDICRLRSRKLIKPLSPSLVFTPSIKIPPTHPKASATPLPTDISTESNGQSSDDLEATREQTIPEVIELDYRSTKFLLHPSGSLVLQSDWRDPTWVSTGTLSRGVDPDRRDVLRNLLGTNLIDLKGRSAFEIFVTEGLHPFNIFQVYSIILWCTDDYVPYAIVIAVITTIGISITVFQTKRAIARMRKMSRFVCKVRKLRRGNNEEVPSSILEKQLSCSEDAIGEEEWDIVDSTELVPGDVVDLAASEQGKIETIPCDCVLLDSDAIVSEAMLTGESVPVAKNGISNSDVPQLQTSARGSNLDKYCVFGGTQLIRARSADGKDKGAAKAVVIQTGFNTAKGSLIRQMLFPREVNFKFYRDAFTAIGILFGLAFIGLIASVIYFHHIGVDPAEIAVRSLDVLTISVPPALPAALSIAITFALARLRRRQIFCTSPQRINVAGMVTAVVFDKTGTLTEEGLSVLGVCCPNGDRLGEVVKTHSDLLQANNKPIDEGLTIQQALSVTHDLNYYGEKLLGEPLEASMFEWTGANLWQDEVSLLQENGQPVTTLEGRPVRAKIIETEGGQSKTGASINPRSAIVRQFEFNAGLRRMSVIVKRDRDPATYVFVKGAAESISALCRQETFPAGFEGQIDRWTHGGYRVLALAGRRIERADWGSVRRMNRPSAESDLVFLGLLIFENKLKSGSAETISFLHDGGIVTKMCTGDAPLTAISVARECGLVSKQYPVFMARVSGGSYDDEKESAIGSVEWVDVDDQQNLLDAYSLEPVDTRTKLADVGLCITGETYAHIVAQAKRETLDRLLVQGQVFARFSPEQKQDLVERLQRIDYTVAMVGDGANDMGALKSADVGLSLSQAEASVAAPFTTEKIQGIEELCREGRNAVSSSVSLFNFFFLYGLSEYFTVLLLYGAPFFSTTMNNAEYLWIDIFLVFPSVFGISASRPSKKLVNKGVRTRIISRRNMTSILVQVVLMILAQMTTYVVLHQQSFYKPPEYDPEDIVTFSQDNTAIFRTSVFTYIIVAIIWNLGPPHRRILLQNYVLLAAVVILGSFNFYFLFCTGGPLFDLFNFEKSLKSSFNFVILGIVLAQFAFAIILELLVVDFLAKLLFVPLRALRRWYTQSLRHREPYPERKRHIIVRDAILSGK